MSYCHVRLKRISDDTSIVTYSVESPDFETNGQWSEIGQIRISKQENRYDFQPSKLLRNHKMIPPWVYGLDEKKKEAALRNEYKNFAWGAWSMAINHYATSFLEKGVFPENHPPVYFPQTKKEKENERLMP